MEFFSFLSHKQDHPFIFIRHHNNRKNKDSSFRRKQHMKNIMTVIFENEAEAYKALSEFRRDPINGDYVISNAAVVKKNGETLSVLDGFETPAGIGSASKGWIIGMITGIFFGFYAMFMGACIGSLIGTFFDRKVIRNNSEVIRNAAKKLEDDKTALLILADEKTAGMIDARLAHYETSMEREPAFRTKEELSSEHGQLHTTC